VKVYCVCANTIALRESVLLSLLLAALTRSAEAVSVTPTAERADSLPACVVPVPLPPPQPISTAVASARALSCKLFVLDIFMSWSSL
jgi:hypothetical protein